MRNHASGVRDTAVVHIDRQIAIWAGWIAGPAFGVAMMASPEYLKLNPPYSGFLFWGGLIVFFVTIVVVVALSLHDDRVKEKVIGPILTMALGTLILGGGIAWYFWPAGGDSQQTHEGSAQSKISVAQASRIVVTKYLLTPVTPTDPKSDLSWQIYIMNRGAIPGYTPQFIFMPRLTDSSLTDTEIDNGMLEVIQAALNMPPFKKQQIEVNQETWFPINDKLVRSNDFDAIKNGQKHLYVWIVLAFTDDALPANKFWISEFCGTQSGDITSIQICRQRTYLHG